MNKIATVQALTESAAQPDRLRVTAVLQEQLLNLIKQISDLELQIQALGKTLMQWAQVSNDLSLQLQSQMLDWAVQLEPILPTLEAIQQQQSVQAQTIARMEKALDRITAVLPVIVESQDGQPPLQPRLVSQRDLKALLIRILEAVQIRPSSKS